MKKQITKEEQIRILKKQINSLTARIAEDTIVIDYKSTSIRDTEEQHKREISELNDIIKHRDLTIKRIDLDNTFKDETIINLQQVIESLGATIIDLQRCNRNLHHNNHNGELRNYEIAAMSPYKMMDFKLAPVKEDFNL